MIKFTCKKHFSVSVLLLVHLNPFFFNCLPLSCRSDAAQLYQQYSEVAQNIEILRQFRSDVPSLCEDPNQSPMPSPTRARRPLPPLPEITSLPSHTSSTTSIQNLPLPDLPRTERRPSSPRLSTSLAQHSLLWRDLPEVRNDPKLAMLTEDQRRLQEVNVLQHIYLMA